MPVTYTMERCETIFGSHDEYIGVVFGVRAVETDDNEEFVADAYLEFVAQPNFGSDMSEECMALARASGIDKKLADQLEWSKVKQTRIPNQVNNVDLDLTPNEPEPLPEPEDPLAEEEDP